MFSWKINIPAIAENGTWIQLVVAARPACNNLYPKVKNICPNCEHIPTKINTIHISVVGGDQTLYVRAKLRGTVNNGK